MQRGEVWWATLEPPVGRRPVLLLSRNTIYPVRAKITFAPLTHTIRHLQSQVLLGPEDGMASLSAVSLDDISTTQKSRQIERITTLSEEKMAEVEKAVRFALDLRVQSSQ